MGSNPTVTPDQRSETDGKVAVTRERLERKDVEGKTPESRERFRRRGHFPRHSRTKEGTGGR